MNVFFKRVTASALALTLLFTTGCSSQPPADTTSGAPAVSAAVYPEMAPYPDESKYINKKTGIFDSEGFDEVYTAWRNDQQARFQQPEGFTNGLADFFGESITVSGLLTGKDMSEQLYGKELGDELIFPENTLRAGEDMFLDDMTPAELSEKLGVPVRPGRNDGAELIREILGVL